MTIRLNTALATIATLLLFSACTATTNESSPSEPERPQNVIFMIGDGMGVTQLTAGHVTNGHHLNITDLPVVGLATTHPHPEQEGNDVVDSAASATAIASGVTTLNGRIGMDIHENPVLGILHHTLEQGWSTGVIATSSITHATPASFVAHDPSRQNMEAIAADFLDVDLDLFIGGGRQYFAERETDDRNLIEELREKGYAVHDDIEGMRSVGSGKLAGFIADGEPARFSEGRGPILPQATGVGLDLLSQNPNGFFLSIEGSQIDWAGHANDMAYIIEEMHDFDAAVGAVMEFARQDGNTLVVITADHETGGTALDQVDITNHTVTGNFTTGSHTGAMVPVFAYGPGSEQFAGVYHQSEIYFKAMGILGFSVE
ncbi:MAG: alkaline phosphatase [Balneolaceae bacterium]